MGDDYLKNTSTSYDAIVDEYERQTAEPTVEFTDFRAWFMNDVKPKGVVADLGCGPGRDTEAFRRLGFRAVGVDASPAMAERSKGRGNSVVVADLRRLPFGDGSLDGIWSSASLLHVPRADVDETLGEWRRCLRSDGVLGVVTSLGDSEGWEDVPYRADDAYKGQDLRRWYVHYSESELIQRLQRAGFRIVSVGYRRSHRSWIQVIAQPSSTLE